MKKAVKKILTAALLMGVCITGAGCRRETHESNGPDCIINQKNIDFLETEQKQAWEKPLAKLLSNVLIPYGEGGEILGEKPVDPDSPAIPMSYACGLMDVNTDGIPELLIHPYGYFGSSGCVTYFAYDIYTGEKMGTIDSGNSESLCVYYQTETDEFLLISQYWLRGGWSARSRYVDKIGFRSDGSDNSGYVNTPYLQTHHAIDALAETPDEWVEVYPETLYYVNAQKTDLDTYYAEYDGFIRNCNPISETSFQTIRWEEVCEDGDSYEEKGRKMAKALINTDQRFVVYQESSGEETS